jgi:cell division septation protein DedD
MTRTENEQEFVLGNRQLISAFFVVVMLLGVFFVMGYIVGNNSKNEAGAKKSASVEPAPTASSALPQDTAPVPPPVVPQEQPPAQTEPARPVVREKALREKAEAPAAVEKSAATHVESAAGHTYLQVSAVKRPAADSIVKTLKDRGFPALLGESSRPELFRVLVGPYADTETLSKAKTDLKAMGFDAVVSK